MNTFSESGLKEKLETNLCITHGAAGVLTRISRFFRKSVLIFVPINLSNAHPYDGSFLSMQTNHKPDPYQKVTDNSRNSVSKRFLFQNS